MNLATFDEVWTTIRDEHFDPQLAGLDWEAIREEYRPLAERSRNRQELRGTLNRMLQLFRQSHMMVFGGPGSAGGLGEEGPLPLEAQVWDTGAGFAVQIVSGVPTVASVEAGSAGAEAGVKAGFEIRSVAGESIALPCRTTAAVTSPLLKARGSRVAVEFVDEAGGEHLVHLPLTNRCTRMYQFEGMQPFRVEFEHKWLEPEVGYIAFNWFFDPMLIMPRFHGAMETFREAEGVIIDVRGNSGGMASMAAGMISWFAGGEQAYLGTTASRHSSLDSYAAPRANGFAGRVAVLTDGSTGSAAEIFSAGMRDAGGARVFGQTTTGAVLPAAFERLPNGDSLLYAIASYETAGGEALEGTGVIPDLVTEIRRGRDITEDEALFSAIDWILGSEEVDSPSNSGKRKHHPRRADRTEEVEELPTRTTSEEEAARAAEILDRHVAVTGGAAAYGQARDRVSTGTLHHTDVNILAALTVHQTASGDQRMHSQSEMLGFHVEGNRNGDAWVENESSGVWILTGQAKRRVLREGPLDAPARWREFFEDVRFVGLETVEGQEAHIVELTARDGSRETRAYSVDSGLHLQTRCVLALEGNLLESVIAYGDYRDVDGLRLPHTIRTRQGENSELLARFETIVHVPGLPAELVEPSRTVRMELDR